MDHSEFGSRLRRVRKERGMTQSDLAAGSGIQLRSIANYETGQTMPGGKALRLLAQHLRCSTDFLLGVDVANSHADVLTPSASVGGAR